LNLSKQLNLDDDLLSVDMLPPPRKVTPKAKEPEIVSPKVSSQDVEVGMADQIAIRSYVLGKSL